MTLAQLCSAFVLVSLVIVLLPIKFSFILSGVFSLKVATFRSNPFEHVQFHFWIFCQNINNSKLQFPSWEGKPQARAQLSRWGVLISGGRRRAGHHKIKSARPNQNITGTSAGAESLNLYFFLPREFLNISFLFFISFLNSNVKEKAKPRTILKTIIFYVRKCLITALQLFTQSFIFEDNSKKICNYLRNISRSFINTSSMFNFQKF